MFQSHFLKRCRHVYQILDFYNCEQLCWKERNLSYTHYLSVSGLFDASVPVYQPFLIIWSQSSTYQSVPQNPCPCVCISVCVHIHLGLPTFSRFVLLFFLVTQCVRVFCMICGYVAVCWKDCPSEICLGFAAVLLKPNFLLPLLFPKAVVIRLLTTILLRLQHKLFHWKFVTTDITFTHELHQMHDVCRTCTHSCLVWTESTSGGGGGGERFLKESKGEKRHLLFCHALIVKSFFYFFIK